MDREKSVPSKPFKARKRYAKLPRGPWVDTAMDTWVNACGSHYALLLLEAEIRRGSTLSLGRWRGSHFAALTTERSPSSSGVNAVSAWAAPSPVTALKRLAFRWSVLMGHSFDPAVWLSVSQPIEMMMPLESGE